MKHRQKAGDTEDTKDLWSSLCHPVLPEAVAMSMHVPGGPLCQQTQNVAYRDPSSLFC